MISIFYIFAAITLGTALMTVIARNPISSAIYMILCFFSIAGHMLLLNSQFLAMVQIIVYSGAIMILVIFTLMLMNLNTEHEPKKKLLSRIIAGIATGLTMFVCMAVLVDSKIVMSKEVNINFEFPSSQLLGEVLMTKYLIPFEFVSVLLIVSMIGTVLISKKSNNKEKNYGK